jgi:hypothetical protein
MVPRASRGDEKADEWAKLAAEEPDARGVEWLRYADRFGGRQTPLPRSLAHLKREISEKNWAEARRRATGRKHKLPSKQRLDGTVAGGGGRLASGFY